MKSRAFIAGAASLLMATLSAPAADQRAEFAGALDRAFLRAGENVEVMTQGDRLILWGWWSRPRVFAAVPETELLAQARGAGLPLVDFADRGPAGHWIWNVAGPALPPCDVARRLCK